MSILGKEREREITRKLHAETAYNIVWIGVILLLVLFILVGAHYAA